MHDPVNKDSKFAVVAVICIATINPLSDNEYLPSIDVDLTLGWTWTWHARFFILTQSRLCAVIELMGRWFLQLRLRLRNGGFVFSLLMQHS